MPNYPLNIVWMIECRHWHDDDDVKSGGAIDQVKEWMRYAPVEPSGFGSGVVIQLEQLDNDDKPLNPPSIKNYLLTCGHVVRSGVYGAGPIATEILCWKPGRGYHRTHQFNNSTNEGRLKRQMKGSYLATISALSPYDGRIVAIPEDHFEPHLDWALLEVCDLPGRPSFDAELSLENGADAAVDSMVRFIGYPNGAGWERDRDSWKIGGQYWSDGEPVEPFHSGEVRIDKVEGKLIELRGIVEVRPGMSGGGVFRTSDNALVGIHRSRHDASLRAEGLCYADIIAWLRRHRRVRPVYSETSGRPQEEPATSRAIDQTQRIKLVASFQEVDGKLVLNTGGKCPEHGIDLWIEDAPQETESVAFQIMDHGVDGRNWSVKRKCNAVQEFLTDASLYGDVEIWCRGTGQGPCSWLVKTSLYEALRKNYDRRSKSRSVQRALKQIREN